MRSDHHPLRPAAYLFAALVMVLYSSAGLFGAEGLPLPAEHGPLQPDPAWHAGRFDNGLAYMLRQHGEQPGRASLRLLVARGSLEETPDELGRMHLLEHMAFAGSRRFPADQAIRRMQELGIGFGHDLNAHTSFDETVYKLELPRVDDQTLGFALDFLADVADGLLIAPAQLEREIGVVLAEMRDRDGPGLRTARALYRVLYDGTLLPDRFPIGMHEQVAATDPESLTELWRRTYLPQAMAVVVVGDLETNAVQAMVEERFATIPARAGPELVELGTPTPAQETVVLVHEESEATRLQLRLLAVVPSPWLRDDAERRRTELALDLACAVLGQYLADVAEEENAPILGGGAGAWQRHGLLHFGVSLHIRPGRTEDAVSVLANELRHWLDLGTEDQQALRTAASVRRASLLRAVEREGARNHADLAVSMSVATRAGRTSLSPAQQLALEDPWLNEMTIADLRAAQDLVWPGATRRVLVLDGPQVDLDQDRLNALWADAMAAPLTQQVRGSDDNWAYGERPESSPSARRMVAHEAIRLDYENGVVAHILPRHEQPGELHVALRLHLGSESLAPGLREAAGRYFAGAGLGAHDASALRRLLAHARSSVRGPDIGEDEAIWRYSGPADELELGLQRLRAALRDPAWRSSVFVRQQSAWLQELQAQASDHNATMSRAWDLLALGGLPQRRAATAAEVEALCLADLRDWSEALLADAPLEIAVVGDGQVEEIQDLLDAYIGSLPQRRPLSVIPDLDAEGALRPAPEPVSGFFRQRIDAEVKRVVIRLAWPTRDAGDVQASRRLHLLARILAEMLREELRERMGETYSPWAGHSASVVWAGSGMLLAQAAVAPEREEALLAAMRSAVLNLVEDGVDDELFARVHRPTVTAIARQRHSNAYWLEQVLLRAASQPQRLAWAANMVDDIAAVTAEELSALARRYLDPKRELALVVVSD